MTATNFWEQSYPVSLHNYQMSPELLKEPSSVYSPWR